MAVYEINGERFEIDDSVQGEQLHNALLEISQSQKQLPALRKKAAETDLPLLDNFGNPVVPDFGLTGTPEEAPTIGEEIVGAGETALSLVTGATGGTAGMIMGTLNQLSEELLSGKFGTQAAAQRIQKEAMKMAGELTYAPRTATAQRNLEMFGEVAEATAPIAGLAHQVQVISNSVRAASPIWRELSGARPQQPTSKDDRFLRVQEPQSVGAGAQSSGQVRVTTAESLPSPIELTKGAAGRSAEQLSFEKEMVKNPQLGEPLRVRAEENNLQALENFDILVDRTGAKAPDIAATGNAVIKALSEGYKKAREETRSAYKKARNSKESNAKVNTAKIVTVGPDDDPVIGTPWDYINSKPKGVESTRLVDSARATAKKLGLVTENKNGDIVPKQGITLGKMEDFRRELSGMASLGDKTGLRDEKILKSMIDAQTESVAGGLYKKARAQRVKQARKYENRAIVARLINNIRGMDDPKVSADLVFKKSILNSSPEEITFLKRVLQTSGEDGVQAWSELQGATIRHIRDRATSNMGMDSNDNPIVSPSKLHNAVTQLDANERLDLVFGKQNAEIIRDLNDVVRYVNTVPPGTLVNNSGTTGMLIAAMAEAGGYGLAAGVPLPILTGLKFLRDGVKNRQIKKKIDEALNGLEDRGK